MSNHNESKSPHNFSNVASASGSGSTTRIQKVRLTTFDVVSRSPVYDPLELTMTTVIAENRADAVDYLLQAGKWRDSDLIRQKLMDNYLLIPSTKEPTQFDVTKFEWIQSVRLGYVPEPFAVKTVASVAADDHARNRNTQSSFHRTN